APVARPAQPPPPPREPGQRPDESVKAAPEPAPSWENAPPVRRGGAAPAGSPAAVAEAHPTPGTGRTIRNIILAGAVTLVSIVVVVGAGAYVYLAYIGGERGLEAVARKAYEEGRFPEASTDYRQLVKNFATSPDVRKYQFFADLSDLRAQLAS